LPVGASLGYQELCQRNGGLCQEDGWRRESQAFANVTDFCIAAPYMPVILGFAPEHLRIFGYNQRKLRFFADRNFFA